MRPEQDLSYHFLFLDIQKISENVALNIRAEIGQNVLNGFLAQNIVKK